MAHTVVADSGDGSEENYLFMSQNGMEAYVKYNYFHGEQRPTKFKPPPFKAENFYYNEEHDFCICPMGQRMRQQTARGMLQCAFGQRPVQMQRNSWSGVKAVPCDVAVLKQKETGR